MDGRAEERTNERTDECRIIPPVWWKFRVVIGTPQVHMQQVQVGARHGLVDRMPGRTVATAAATSGRNMAPTMQR